MDWAEAARCGRVSASVGSTDSTASMGEPPVVGAASVVVGAAVELEVAWGSGAMRDSGRSTTKRLGWRKPRGSVGKSAVAMPEPVAVGASGASEWATRGWRRPQK